MDVAKTTQNKEKKLKGVEDKSGYCLELKMTGIHAVSYLPCQECNRSVTTFMQKPQALLKCRTQQCLEVGECVCGQNEIDDYDRMENDELDQIYFN